MNVNPHLATIRGNPRALAAYERVRAVLDGGVPDRVPFLDSYWREFWERYLAERALPPETDFREHFDHDGVVLAPVMGPWPRKAGELGRDGKGPVLKRDDFGLVTADIPGVTTMSRHVECAIKEPRDLDRFPFEDPESESRTAQLARALPVACGRECGSRGSGSASMAGSSF